MPLLAGLSLAQQPEAARILRPLDRSVLQAGPLTVIARVSGKGELKLDGKPLAVKEPAPGVLTAQVNPAEGQHELSLDTPAGERKILFRVGGAPSGEWKAYRTHPPSANCDACHVAQDGVWSIKGEAVAPNCFACHDAKAFPPPHAHTPQVLEECQLCHNPHGSTAQSHLKMPKEVACKQCHG